MPTTPAPPTTGIEELIYARLTTDPQVTALIPASNMFFLTRFEQGTTWPALSYQLISTDRLTTQAGENGLRLSRITFVAGHPRFTVARQVKEAVALSLINMSSTVDGHTDRNLATVVMERSDLDSDRTDPLFLEFFDMMIWWSVAQPL